MNSLVIVTLLSSVMMFGQTPAQPPPTQPPAPPVVISVPNPEPSQFFSAGSGIIGLGPSQAFGYYSISEHIATGTYATQISELFRMKGGTVGICARAGVSRVLWTIGYMKLGVVGDAGACEGPSGSASGAVAERGFVSVKLGKGNVYFVGTAENLKVAGNSNQAVVSIGIGFGIK